MKTTLDRNGQVFLLDERIDSGNAASVEAEIRAAMDAHPGVPVLMDASSLQYISSAGLRAIMAVRNKNGGPYPVLDVSPEVYGIFEVTGFTELLDVRRRLREISIEGCEIIGRGAVGTVYRLDPDTIVKIYDVPDAMAMIGNEKRLARLAFLKGIPTPISFDIVKAGGRYGTVFELVRAVSLRDLYLQEPGREESLTKMYARVILQVHSVEMTPGELPDSRDGFLKFLDAVAEILGPELTGRLRGLLTAMPEDLHVIHGDFHMKNLMFSDDDPVLIDMDTLSVGNLVFEMAGLFAGYMTFGLDEPDNCLRFLGLPQEKVDRIWRVLLRSCTEGSAETEDRIRLLGWLRFLYLVAVLEMGLPELLGARIRRSVDNLTELAARVGSLAI